MTRRPIALANWKMSMTVAESLAFVRRLQELAGDLLDRTDVVLCPPCTALWALSREMEGGRLQLGGQDFSSESDLARTGEISAELLADAGCRWAMVGHWEVRRNLGDDEETINRKVHLAIDAGLRPILFVGEAKEGSPGQREALRAQLDSMLAGVGQDQVAQMAFVYEPEGAIGAASPSAVEQVAGGAEAIRGWLRDRRTDAAERARVMYGGSVDLEHAAGLLACPELDGLGATRRGRDAGLFAEIVRQIAEARLR
jgi:triosephosphate isomerase